MEVSRWEFEAGMNLILFEEPFESVRLEGNDPRAKHLHEVLRVKVGAPVFIGFVNGPRARAEVVSIDQDGSCELKVIATETAPGLLPITLLIGLPRPHTARRVLFEAASMGVAAMHFFQADHSEPSYAKSRLWQTKKWRERLLRGAEQAFGTCLPEVDLHADMQSGMAALPESSAKVALDNYEAGDSLGAVSLGNSAGVTVAIGAERGWSAAERSVFRENHWQLAHLGPNVLRTETACVAAVSVVASKLGVWRERAG